MGVAVAAPAREQRVGPLSGHDGESRRVVAGLVLGEDEPQPERVGRALHDAPEGTLPVRLATDEGHQEALPVLVLVVLWLELGRGELPDQSLGEHQRAVWVA
jgi:hypothetical protein